jgi:hypothetical protein
MNPHIPDGAGDPLVRWLVSRESGHCELFAGAFTLLARAAGHPTRVIGGFVGGVWNGDYLIVRNSNAHAWCELFDGAGNWVRVDPTASAGRGSERSGLDGLMESATLRDDTGGWTGAMDRMRLFWYRRIVNFDQSDQRVLTSALKENAQEAGRNLREFARRAIERGRVWLDRPWSGVRIGAAAGVAAGFVLAWWAWRRKGRSWWLSWRSARGGGIDPVRREAGKWLRRLDEHGLSAKTPGDDVAVRIREELQRVRYGPRESWPATGLLWARARRLSRRRRGSVE